MKICIPIKQKSQKEVRKSLIEASKHAEIAEIWIDQIQDLDLAELLKNSPLKTLITCKRSKDGGNFKGSDKELAEHLVDACKLNADYIDIPLNITENMNKKYVQEAKKSGTKILISYHDHRKTPSFEELQKMANKMIAREADVVKIATMANSLEDAINMIALADHLKRRKVKHCLIAMGKKGQLSRILTPTLGGEMMFAVLSKKRQTALGQLTAKELRSAWELL